MADPACVVLDLLPSKPPPAVRAKPKTEAIEVIDLLDEDDVLDAPQCGSEQRLQIVEVVTKREEEKPELPQQAGNALVALAPTPTESEQRAKKKKNRRYTGTPSRKTSSLVCSTPCSAVESGLPMDRLVLVRKEGKEEPLKERAKRRKIRAPQRFTYDEFPGTGVRRGEQRDKSPQQGNGEEDKHDSPPTRLRDIFKTTKRTRRVDPKRKRTQSQEELKATATEVEVEQSTLEALRQSLESRRRVTVALREKLEVAEAVEARFCKKISDHELQLRKKNALLEDAKSRFSSEDDLNIDEDDEVDRNDDWCFVCEEGGKLICCATCEKSFHAECIDATEEEMKEDPWSCPTCVDSNLQWVEGKPSKKTKACSRSDERVINGEEREELVHKFRKDFLRIKDLAVVMSEIMKTQEHFNSLQTRHMIKRGQVS